MLHLPSLFLLLSCSSQTTAIEPSREIISYPNIVMITMDTTRQDHLGIYGHAAARTETIDQFAQKGYRFTNAYSSVPLTTPSHASMLTGLYPPHHGIRSNGDAILPEDIHTLPELLQKKGYQTVASVSAFVTTRIWNLDQGFSHYFDRIDQQKGGRWAQERPAEDVINDLLEWNKSQKTEAPFFMWVHLYDPHHPHIVHEGYESFENKYDAEIAYMDDQIERLRAALSKDDPDTIWVLLADHGEAFHGEHSETSHGLFLYDETMRIPWIIQPYPPLQKGQVLDVPISVVDLPNTVLGMIGIEELQNTDGVNIFQSRHSKPLYMESSVVRQRFGYHPEIALTDGRLKLMPTPTPHLYDITKDPKELDNIYQQTQQWDEWGAYGVKLFQELPQFSLNTPDASVVKQLEMLGYMGGSEQGEDLSAYTIDAKDRLATIQELENIVRARKEQATPNEIISRFEQIIEKEPQLAEARLLLGQTLNIMGRKREAIAVFEEARRRNPGSVILSLNLANQYADIGEYQKGIEILEEVLQRVPGDSGAQSNIIRMMSDANDHKGAIARGGQWLKENPSENLQAILGVILVRDQQFLLAKELLQLSLMDGIAREHVHRSLGHIAIFESNPEAAKKEYELELEQFPDTTLQQKLAKMYSRDNHWAKAVEHFCAVSRERPNDARAHLDCAQAWFNLEQYEKAETALAKAKKIRPRGPYILLLEANIEAKIGDKKKAEEIFKKAKQEMERQMSLAPVKKP